MDNNPRRRPARATRTPYKRYLSFGVVPKTTKRRWRILEELRSHQHDQVQQNEQGGIDRDSRQHDNEDGDGLQYIMQEERVCSDSDTEVRTG